MLALIAVFVCANAPAYAGTLVLPFSNLSKTQNIEWIGESISETIRDALAVEGVIVLDREDRQEAYKRLSLRPDSLLTRASVMKLGESLDADQVIYGTYEVLSPDATSKNRGSLRMTAQLLNLRTLTRGSEYTEVGALDDLAVLQAHLAWQMLQFVLPKTAPSEAEYRSRQPLMRVEAIEHYVRGLLVPAADQKLRFFAQAVRLEPRYSQANFQLGRLHWGKKAYKLAAEHLARVTPADVHYREANFLLGLCRYYAGDFAGAQQSFEMVAQEVPLNEVLNNLAAAQSRRNLPGAITNFRKALEGDAGDPDYHFNVGYALYKRGDLEAAADEFRAVLDRSPEDAEAITMLGRCLKKTASGKSDGLERMKLEFEESAYMQLKAVLEPKR